MPTKVSVLVEAAPDDSDETTTASEKSERADPHDGSQPLDTSVNMLLDDTIDSDSESELVDSSDEEERDNKRADLKPTTRDNFSIIEGTGESATTEQRHMKSMFGAPFQRQRNPYEVTDNEANILDSGSSFQSTPRRRKSESRVDGLEIPPWGTEKDEARLSDREPPLDLTDRPSSNKPTINRSGNVVNAGIPPITNGSNPDETTLSYSDWSLQSPQRQKNDQPQMDGVRNVTGGMSRSGTDSDESKILISFQDLDCKMDNFYPISNNAKSRVKPSSLKGEAAVIRRGSNKACEQRPPLETKFQWRQQKDCDSFRLKFEEIVSDFKHRNPHVFLDDYQNMSTDEQLKEQQKVISLLDRLSIRTKGPGETTNEETEMDAALDQDMSITRLESSIKSMTSSPSNSHRFARRQKEESLGSLKLSPIARQSPKSLRINSAGGVSHRSQPTVQQESPMFMKDDSASEMSAEITRAADESSLYQSPPLRSSHVCNAAKRLATTSGKRGQDTSRVRLNPDLPLNDSSRDSTPKPGPSWHSSDDSISFVSGHASDDHPFAASQSPITGYISRQDHLRRSPQIRRQRQNYRHDYSYEEISPKSDVSRTRDNHKDRLSDERSTRDCDTISSRRQSEREAKRPTQGERQPSQRYDDSIETVNATAFQGPHGRARLRDTTNIGLKEGAIFHYNPLLIKGSKRRCHKDRSTMEQPLHRFVDFRDPLAEKGSGSELYQVFEWMVERDCSTSQRGRKWSTNSKGIIFSLEKEQIVNVTIKFLINSDTHSQGRRESYSDTPSLIGETLIVVRCKDDFGLWERALREHTPFSVINHAALTSRERKKTTAASRCATYDVVISTYDALKSQDATVQIDDDGHATVGQGVESQSLGGWMTKRSTSSAESSQRLIGFSQPIESAIRCKQLSALHRVQWKRIIFTDGLGRKCYLTKSGTARVVAAAAVNSQSRYVFFTKEKGESNRSAFESLLKSDMRAIPSVASVLRIEVDGDDGGDEDLLDVIFDPRQGI